MDNRTLFGIMMILFNGYGVPSFMQGDVKNGILKIVLGIVTCSVLFYVNTIMGIIEGIKILKMTDEEYAEKKGTFFVGIPAATAE